MALCEQLLSSIILGVSTWFWLWFIIWENEQRAKEAKESDGD